MIFDIESAVGEAAAVHKNSSATDYFSIFSKKADGKTSQKQFKLGNLTAVVGQIKDTPDTYISQCSFISNSRRTVNLSNIGCAFVDIDCYNLGIAPDDEFISRLLDKAVCHGIPRPSYVIQSGRGIYLKWLFTKSLGAANLYRWNALQLVLVSLYKSIGGDMAAKDASRVLRVVGSSNTAAGGDIVRVAWNGGQRYDFEALNADVACVDLQDLSAGNSTGNSAGTRAAAAVHQARVKKLGLDEPGTKLERLQQEKAVIGHLNRYAERNTPVMMAALSLHQLNWRRFLDLRDLCAMRKGVHRGSRDLTLFWMGNFLSHSGVVTPDNFNETMGELASGFPGADFKPMADKSLTTLFSRLEAYRRGEKVTFQGQKYSSLYTPTNSKLIEIFEITALEQRSLATVIDGREKQLRADEKVPGRIERRQETVTWRLQANAMAGSALELGQVPNVSEIARAVGIHKTQVSRLLAKKIGQPRKLRASVPRHAQVSSNDGVALARVQTNWIHQRPSGSMLSQEGRAEALTETLQAVQPASQLIELTDTAHTSQGPQCSPLQSPVISNATVNGTAPTHLVTNDLAKSLHEGLHEGFTSASLLSENRLEMYAIETKKMTKKLEQTPSPFACLVPSFKANTSPGVASFALSRGGDEGKPSSGRVFINGENKENLVDQSFFGLGFSDFSIAKKQSKKEVEKKANIELDYIELMSPEDGKVEIERLIAKSNAACQLKLSDEAGLKNANEKANINKMDLQMQPFESKLQNLKRRLAAR